jgi:hypothetical protein
VTLRGRREGLPGAVGTASSGGSPPRSRSGWTSVEGAGLVSAAPRVLQGPFARRRRSGAMGSICHPAERPRPQADPRLGVARWSGCPRGSRGFSWWFRRSQVSFLSTPRSSGSPMRGLRRQPSKKVAPRRGWRPEGPAGGVPVSLELFTVRERTTPPVERWGGKERPGTSGSWPWPLTRVASTRLDREEGASRQRTLRPTSERRFGGPSRDGGCLFPVTDVSEGGFAAKVPLSSRERRVAARPLVPNLVTMPARRNPTEVSLVKNGRCFRDPQRANAKALEGYDGHDDGASPAG